VPACDSLARCRATYGQASCQDPIRRQLATAACICWTASSACSPDGIPAVIDRRRSTGCGSLSQAVTALRPRSSMRLARTSARLLGRTARLAHMMEAETGSGCLDAVAADLDDVRNRIRAAVLP